MTQKAPLFASGRILTQPQPFPLDAELENYIGRHLTGDWGTYGKYADGEDSHAANPHAILCGGSVVSLCRTPLGWLWIRTAPLLPNGRADARTETWCFLLDECWEGPVDERRPCSVENPN